MSIVPATPTTPARASNPIRLLSLASLMASLSFACAPEPTSDHEAYSDVAISSPNGRTFNGRWPNGRWPNGRWPNGVSLNDVSIGSGAISSVSVRGSQLIGIDASGNAISGHDFIGANLYAFFDDGSTAQLHIDNVDAATDPTPGLVNEGVVWTYTVSATIDGVTGPLCDDGAGNPIEAFALAGRWDYREGVPGGGAKIADPAAFTFACRRVGALGKCVDIGYKPWASIRTGRGKNSRLVSLEPYHQACIRMLRADYCGDGKSWTVDGTVIDLYDNVGIQSQTTSWTIDAEWGASGALCAGEISSATSGSTFDTQASALAIGNDNTTDVREDPDGNIATCYSALYKASCGTFSSGALIIDRHN